MTRLNLDILSGGSVHILMEPFFCRLKAITSLTADEEHFIETLQPRVRSFDAGAYVYTEGDPTLLPWIVGSGWACRLRVLPDGRRQIISFILPGDTIGVCEQQHPAVQPTILAITELRLLGAAKLVEAIDRSGDGTTNIKHACRFQQVLAQARLLDHIQRLGRLSALERMAHLLLELHARMGYAKLAKDGKFPLPITQAQFGEALGLSLVHVNRTLQQLRRDRLIELKPGHVAILDQERLELLCDYRKLQLVPERQAR